MLCLVHHYTYQLASTIVPSTIPILQVTIVDTLSSPESLPWTRKKKVPIVPQPSSLCWQPKLCAIYGVDHDGHHKLGNDVIAPLLSLPISLIIFVTSSHARGSPPSTLSCQCGAPKDFDCGCHLGARESTAACSEGCNVADEGPAPSCRYGNNTEACNSTKAREI